MKKNTLLLGMLISLFFACSGDDDANNNLGTYTLTSIKTGTPIDPDANGSFDDTELIDNVGCSPKIILNTDNTLIIDDFNIYQPASSNNGNLSLSHIACNLYSAVNGSYSITDGSLISNSNDQTTIYSISENKITLTKQKNFFTSSADSYPSSVATTFTYTK